MNDDNIQNNNDDLNCRLKGRKKNACGINNFDADFGITITNDEEFTINWINLTIELFIFNPFPHT